MKYKRCCGLVCLFVLMLSVPWPHNWFTYINRSKYRHFANDIFQWIFLNANVWISIVISLKFVPNGQFCNIPSLVQLIVWRRSDDKPLSEPMIVNLLTHICVTRPKWAIKKYTSNVSIVKFYISYCFVELFVCQETSSIAVYVLFEVDLTRIIFQDTFHILVYFDICTSVPHWDRM